MKTLMIYLKQFHRFIIKQGRYREIKSSREFFLKSHNGGSKNVYVGNKADAEQQRKQNDCG